jgi:hypothetical protein
MGIALNIQRRTEEYRQTLLVARALVVILPGNPRSTSSLVPRLAFRGKRLEETKMGRGILLWLLGVPIPIIILLALIWH